MPIPIQVRGYSIAHRSKARPAAVAESGDGGSWEEQAFQHRHWRAWSTRRAISLPPAMASSRRSIAISETLQTSAISQLIIAARSPVFRARRVGISARVLAASKVRPESKRLPAPKKAQVDQDAPSLRGWGSKTELQVGPTPQAAANNLHRRGVLANVGMFRSDNRGAGRRRHKDPKYAPIGSTAR